MKEKNTGILPVSRKKTLVEEVIQTLSTYILDGLYEGRLREGEKLPSERELAELLSVGRSTLREAIKILIYLNLLEIRPGHGTFISSGISEYSGKSFSLGLILQKGSFHELIETRIMIESECAALACDRGSKEELLEIGEALRKMNVASKKSDPHAIRDADLQFHLLVAKAAHNKVMYETLRNVRGLLSLWIAKVLTEDTDSREETLQEHAEIYQAIAQREAEHAREKMRSHLVNGCQRLQKILNEKEG